MTLAGAAALSKAPLPRNVFLVQLRRPADQAAIARLKQQFPGAVLPAVPPPEVRNLRGVNGLPLALALLLALLATGTVAHTLITSVRRRRRELAILKAVGFVARQVRATVAWQATAMAASSLIIGLPLGIAAGRWAWTLFATQFAIEARAGHLPAGAVRIPRRPPAGKRGRRLPRPSRRAHATCRGAKSRVIRCSRGAPAAAGRPHIHRPDKTSIAADSTRPVTGRSARARVRRSGCFTTAPSAGRMWRVLPALLLSGRGLGWWGRRAGAWVPA